MIDSGKSWATRNLKQKLCDWMIFVPPKTFLSCFRASRKSPAKAMSKVAIAQRMASHFEYLSGTETSSSSNIRRKLLLASLFSRSSKPRNKSSPRRECVSLKRRGGMLRFLSGIALQPCRTSHLPCFLHLGTCFAPRKRNLLYRLRLSSAVQRSREYEPN